NAIYRTLGDATEAEDLAQNVFVQVYKSAHRYRASARFSTWLFTIARNLCLNEIRRRSRHRAQSLDAPHPEQGDWPGHQFEDAKGGGRVEAKIEALPSNRLMEGISKVNATFTDRRF